MDAEVKYAENYTVKTVELPSTKGRWNPRGVGQSGYGSKIATDYMIRFKGEKPQRDYRVYAICWSNVASHYVIQKGERLFLKDWELE